MKNRVIIIDDHPVVILALRHILSKNGYCIIGEASNGSEGLKLIRELKPDVVIADLSLPCLDGIEVTRRAVMEKNAPDIIILTAQKTEYFMLSCLRAGAKGFVPKERGLYEIEEALKMVSLGYSYFPIETFAKGKKVQDAELIEALSARELMVFKHLTDGEPNKNIASLMSVSEKTVSTYKYRLFKKLNVSNLVELIEMAKRNDIN